MDGQSTPPSGSFVDVSAGARHTCGVEIDGSLSCWGYAADDRTEPPDGIFSEVSTGAGHACAVVSGAPSEPCADDAVYDCVLECVSEDIVDAYVGDDFCDDGFWDVHLYCDAFDFDAGDCADESIATPELKTVQCWGFDYFGQATAPAGEFVSATAGSNHSCAIAADGSAQCWGSDLDGPASPPAGDFQQVSAGNRHSCGVTTEGSAECWGYNGFGESSPPSL